MRSSTWMSDSNAQPDEALIQGEMAQRLARLVWELPPEQAAFMRLVESERTDEQIALELGISIEDVQARRHAGCQVLKRLAMQTQ